VIGALILVLVILGGIFFLVSKKQVKPENTAAGEQQEIPKLSSDEIGLSIAMGEDGRRVIMEISKIEDIEEVEYQLSYTSEGDIPRGVIGMVEAKGRSIKKEIVLGTCSDVCHYDEDVSDIKIIIKVTKIDGKVYQVEKALEE